MNTHPTFARLVHGAVCASSFPPHVLARENPQACSFPKGKSFLFSLSLLLLFSLLFGDKARAQSSYTMYYQSGPETTMQADSSSTGFEVPLERTGHNFTFYWRTTAGGTVNSGSAYPKGFVTSGSLVLRSLLVTAYTPSTYTSTPYTYTSNGTTYTSYTSTTVPFACVEWWLVDSTVNHSTPHYSGTPVHQVDLRTAAWAAVGGGVTYRYLAISDSRFGHALVSGSVASGWTSVIPGNYRFSTYSNGTTGTQLPPIFFTAMATASTGDFYLADRTDGKKAPLNQTNTIWAQWEYDYGIYPLVPVKVRVDPREAGHRFTARYQLAGAPPYAVTGAAVTANNMTAINFTLASGVPFRVTRDAEDGSAGQPVAPGTGNWTATANATYLATGLFPQVPLRANAPVAHTISVNATNRPQHTFSVRTTDGYTTAYNYSVHNDAVTGQQTAAIEISQINNWWDDGSPHHLTIYIFTAYIDPSRVATLWDDTANVALTTIDQNVPATEWLEGWQPLHGNPPTDPWITLQLPQSRASHLFSILLTEPNTWSGPLTVQDIGSLEEQYFAGWNGLAAFSLHPLALTLTNPVPYVAGPFLLKDLITSETQQGILAGTNDLRTWWQPPHDVDLQICEGRWDHELIVRHATGEFFPILRQQTGADTSIDANHTLSQNGYYYFHAVGQARDDIPWYLEDLETGERLGFPNGFAHPTLDAQIMWFALLVPQGLEGTIDATLRAAVLRWPIGAAAPEGAFEVERQRTGENAWQLIRTVPATSATNGWLQCVDPDLIVQKVHSYRIRYAYGEGAARRRSGRSKVVILTGWRDTDGDGLKDAEEELRGTNPNEPDSDHDGVSDGNEVADGTNPLKADSDDDGLSDSEEIAAGTNPTGEDTDGDGVKDGADAFPLDSRRQKELPLLRYVPVDISTPSDAGQRNVESVAIDDAGSIGFVWTDEATDSYQTAVWEPASGASVRLTLPRKGSVKALEYVEEDTNPADEFPPLKRHINYRTDYASAKVNASGNLAVNIEARSVDWVDQDPLEDQSHFPTPDPAAPHGGYPYESSYGKRATGMGLFEGAMKEGVLVVPEFKLKKDGIDSEGGAVQNYFLKGFSNDNSMWAWDQEEESNTMYRGLEFPKWTDSNPPDPYVQIRPGFSIAQINSNGGACGTRVAWDVNHNRREFVEWNNGSFFPVFGEGDTEAVFDTNTVSLGINDSLEIYGFSPWLEIKYPDQVYPDHPDPEAAHPFFFSDQQATDIYYFIPEAYRKHISVHNDDRTPVVFNSNGDMIFSAHVADGPPDDPIWRPAQLLLDRAHQTVHEVTGAPTDYGVMSNDWVLCGRQERPVLYGGAPVPNPLFLPSFVPLTTKRAFAYAALEVVRLDSDGNPTDRPEDFTPSAPSPVVEAYAPDVTNIHLDESGKMVGRVRIQGSITSRYCDTLPGSDGKIEEIDLFVNDPEDPNGTPVATRPVTVSKETTGTTLGRPYPYSGTFDHIIENVHLTEGRNVFRLSAKDKVYKIRGYNEWAVDITATATANIGTNVTTAPFTTSAPTAPNAATGLRSLTVSYGKADGTALNTTLVETARYSGRFNATVNGVNIEATIDNGGVSHNISAAVSDPQRGFVNRQFHLSSTALGASTFSGGLSYLANSSGQEVPPPAFEDDDAASPPTSFVAENVFKIDQSSGGELHLFTVRLRTPAAAAANFEIQLGTENPDDPGTLRTKFINYPGDPQNCYAERPGQPGRPLVLTTRPVVPKAFSINDAYLLEQLANGLVNANNDSAKFTVGFFVGIAAGGVEFVVDSAKFIKGATNYGVNDASLLGISAWIYVKGNLLGLDVKDAVQFQKDISASQDEVHESVADVVEMLAPLVKMLTEVEQKRTELMIGLMTGRIKVADIPDKALHFSERHREMFLFCAEFLELMCKDFGNKEPYDRGYTVGRGFFEVGSILTTPEAIAGKLTKLKFLQALRARAGAGAKWLPAARAAEMEVLIGKIATSKMCFVAGTLVWTVQGLRAIEEIGERDEVLSRDEFTGRQEYRPVVNTIITHPAALVHVRYAGLSRHGGGNEVSDGSGSEDAEADEELVCTAEHPFYVGNRERPGFVEAGELQVGDEFRLADGGAAAVLGLRTEVAAEGKPFTTYNIEVADFHTYFVGRSGVWVHNFSEVFCDAFYTLTRAVQKDMGIAEGAETGQRLEIVKGALRRINIARKEEAAEFVNQSLHTVGREELLKANGNSTLVPTVRDFRDARLEFRAQAKVPKGEDFSYWYDIHHLWEKWATEMLEIPSNLRDTCPGLVMPRSPKDAFFDAAQYSARWGEQPVYHQDLAHDLNAIYNTFREKMPLSVGDKKNLIKEIKDLYESPAYERLKMWPATRDWLSRQANIPVLLPP